MERKIIHVDMDAFYAAIEQRDRPQLRGRPVIVGGRPEARGVVAAASYEARRFGIHSAMPTARALKLCPQAILREPRLSYYRQISQAIHEILYSYTPLVEPLSLDEAFLDVTGSERLFGPAEKIGHQLKQRIKEELSLTCSLGLAPNKFLAKLASDLKKPDGFVIIRPEQIEEFLRDLPISRLWGVGPATEERLRKLGVLCIGDLWRLSREELIGRFGRWGARLYDLARGIDERPVTPEHEKKSISRETTFPQDLYDGQKLLETLEELAEEVADELQQERLKARTVQIKVRFEDFTTITRRITLQEPIETSRVIREAARLLLQHKVEFEGRGVRLLGVGVSHLEASKAGQLALFAVENSDEPGLVLEELRRRFKEHSA